MNFTRYILLSYPIREDTPVYGETPLPLIIPQTKISEGHSSNTFIISIHNHTGTHVDAPAHFVEGGRTISEYSLEELIFLRPLLIDCSAKVSDFIPLKEYVEENENVKNADILLLKTCFSLARSEDTSRKKNPGLKSEEILWLRKEHPGVRALGVDTISISSTANREEGRKAHRAAFKKEEGLGEPLLIIEYMNLSKLERWDLIKKIIVAPWSIENIDSAPCTVFAELKSQS